MFVANGTVTDLPRSERSVVDAVAPSPGLVLCNVLASSRKRVRELDVLIVHPNGFAVVEVKGTALTGEVDTDLNAEWTVGGQVADFAGGPNPTMQARTAAAAASGHLSRGRDQRVFVAAIVALSGDVQIRPHRVGDVWVCRTDQVPAVLLGLTAHPVDAPTACEAMAAFGVGVDIDLAAAEGFPERVAAPEGGSRAVRRRGAERQQELEGVAMHMWRSSHRRLVLVSLLATVLGAYYLSSLTWASALAGVAAASAVAAWQYRRRGQLAGVRMMGASAVAGWLITLTPYLTAGVALATPWVSGVSHQVEALWLLQLNGSVLAALALLLATRVGRCGFIYPPPEVAERLNAAGEPTGRYVLVTSGSSRHNIGLLDPLDPRSKVLSPGHDKSPQ